VSFRDDMEDEGPQEGDWVTDDHHTFREHDGRGVFHVDLESDMWKQIEAEMAARRFWPNVWFVSDHGNARVMTPPRRRRGRR